MSFLAYYTVLNVITLFLLFFFAGVILSLRKGAAANRVLLAALLVALAMSYVDGAVLLFRPFFFDRFPHAFYVGMSFDFLVGPLLWLYVRVRTGATLRLRPIHAFHALPFMAHASLLASRFHLHPVEAKRALLEADGVFGSVEIELLVLLVHAHFSVYCVLALWPALAYRKRLRQLYASDRASDWRWVATVLLGFLTIWCLRGLNSLLWMQVPDWMRAHDVEVRPIIILGTFLFACMLFVQALRRPDILFHDEKVKYRTALLSRVEQQQYAELLRKHMEEKKPHMNPSLDLRGLAAGVGLAPQQLSQVLNVALEQNFFDFVNGYRVQESRRLLTDPRASHKNIAEIMFEAGFNSKSVFNTAFKRVTGMTPTTYRASAAHRPVDPGRRTHSAASGAA